MSKKDTRNPIPEDKLSYFMMMVTGLSKVCEIDDIPEVSHYVDVLQRAVEREIFDRSHTPPVNKRHVERQKFIAIFKTRYLAFTDMEYKKAVTPVDGKMITQVVDRLAESGFVSSEMLKWLFEDFLPDNEKFCPPAIRFACSSFIVEKFLYEYRHRIKEKRDEQAEEREALDLIRRARVLIRNAKDNEERKEKIKDSLKKYRSGDIMLSELRIHIKTFEAEEESP